MENTNKPISTSHLRSLLEELAINKAGTCFRFRLLGEMWKPNFMRVVRLTERGAIFMDESTHEFVFLSELTDIVQFEIDNQLQGLQPHFHYEVMPK